MGLGKKEQRHRCPISFIFAPITIILAPTGAVYFYSGHVQIELYTKEKNIEAEAALESAMSEIFWTKTETYLESEKCWQVLYEIEV